MTEKEYFCDYFYHLTLSFISKDIKPISRDMITIPGNNDYSDKISQKERKPSFYINHVYERNKRKNLVQCS